MQLASRQDAVITGGGTLGSVAVLQSDSRQILLKWSSVDAERPYPRYGEATLRYFATAFSVTVNSLMISGYNKVLQQKSVAPFFKKLPERATRQTKTPLISFRWPGTFCHSPGRKTFTWHQFPCCWAEGIVKLEMCEWHSQPLHMPAPGFFGRHF